MAENENPETPTTPAAGTPAPATGVAATPPVATPVAPFDVAAAVRTAIAGAAPTTPVVAAPPSAPVVAPTSVQEPSIAEPDTSAAVPTIEALQAQLEALRADFTASKKEVAAVKAAARRDALVNAGIAKDEYLRFAPDVDVTSSEGKATLDNWIQAHPELFKSKAPATPAVEVHPTARNPLYQPNEGSLMDRLRSRFGGGN